VTRRAAAIELALFLSLVFSFIWLWREARWAGPIVYVLGLGLTISTHILHGESPRAIGFRMDNLSVALKEAAIPTVPLVAGLVIIGISGGHWRWDALDPGRFLDIVAWAFLQQYLLQGFIHRRIAGLLPEWPRWRLIVVGLVFGALHLPNPVLVPVTCVAGCVFALLFSRRPNIWVLALCHAVGSTAVAFAFEPGILRSMRVGPGYWR